MDNNAIAKAEGITQSKTAAIIIIIHGIIELLGFFAVLPLWLGAEQGAWVPFDPPEPINLPLTQQHREG